MLIRETTIPAPAASNGAGNAIRANLVTQTLELEKLLADMRSGALPPLR